MPSLICGLCFSLLWEVLDSRAAIPREVPVLERRHLPRECTALLWERQRFRQGNKYRANRNHTTSTTCPRSGWRVFARDPQAKACEESPFGSKDIVGEAMRNPRSKIPHILHRIVLEIVAT